MNSISEDKMSCFARIIVKRIRKLTTFVILLSWICSVFALVAYGLHNKSIEYPAWRNMKHKRNYFLKRFEDAHSLKFF